MRPVGKQNDPADVAGNFGTFGQSRDVANHKGDQNTETYRPRIGLQYLAERGAACSSYDRSHHSQQSKFAGPGRRVVGDDDRCN